MLYHLLYPLKDFFSPLNIFQYITFRSSIAAIMALLISFLLGPVIIRKLKELQIGEEIRDFGPESHLKKKGTPTMGGFIILTAIILPTFLLADLNNPFIEILLISTIWMGLIGFIDDYLIESDFVLLLIQNTCTGGDRLRLAPNAQIDDGKMDLGIIYHIGRFKILKLFNQLKAQGSHVWNPNVEFYRFKTLRIETEEPTSINIDGENLGTTPLDIKVLPSAIKVFN